MPIMALPSPYAAYLRVYEPLSAFPEPERTDWAEYAARGTSRDVRLVAEHQASLVGIVSVPPRPVPAAEREAFVLAVEDDVHVCPVQARLRSWVALGQFRDGLPEALLHAFVPPMSLEQAEADHEQWTRDEAGATLRILTATWSVPVSWFVPFAPADRVVDVSDGHPTVVHRTRMSGARRRVARALRTVRTSLMDPAGPGGADGAEGLDVVAELDQLGRWLEEFHPRSWVELDYAGLARLMGLRGVSSDTSVADVAAALTALAEGDEAAAALRYGAVVERWATVASWERAN